MDKVKTALGVAGAGAVIYAGYKLFGPSDDNGDNGNNGDNGDNGDPYPYKCTYYECGAEFATQAELDLHWLEVHNIDPPPPVYYCPHCNETFATQAELAYHIETEHAIVPPVYTCPDCGEEFATSGELANHMATVHGTTPSGPAPLTVCRLSIVHSIDYLDPNIYDNLGSHLLGDYGSNIYHGQTPLGGIICPLSLPKDTPIVGYWTQPQEANESAPIVTPPGGIEFSLEVFDEVMSDSGIRRRYGPVMTSLEGLYQINYMGQTSYWEVEPWAEITSFTYEDVYLTRTYHATISILKNWGSDWLFCTGFKWADKLNIGSLGIGTYNYDWDRSFAKAEQAEMVRVPYLLLSRQSVQNRFHNGNEQCATALNRAVIIVPQTVGVVAAYKSG